MNMSHCQSRYICSHIKRCARKIKLAAGGILPGRASPEGRAPRPDIEEGARTTPCPTRPSAPWPVFIPLLLLLPQVSPLAPSAPSPSQPLLSRCRF